MELYHLGENELKFVVYYHIANNLNAQKTGVIICAPIGQEFVRYYKTLNILAVELSKNGFHTVRFDYYGTGDSYGLDKDISLDGCLSNIKDVIIELKDGVDIEHVCLIGIRIGALFASLYLQNNLCSQLVLLEPCLNGRKYIDEILLDQEEFISGSFAKNLIKSKEIESLGFLYNTNFVGEIKNIEIDYFKDINCEKVLIINGNTEKDEFKNCSNMTFLETRNKNFWRKKDSESEKSQVAYQEITQIIEWINLNK